MPIPLLFSPIQFRELEFKNRIFVSPMCQYSAENGIPDSWHLVHLGSRAVGGAALVVAEATAITPEGRISPGDLGIWNHEQVAAFKPITEFIRAQNCVPGVQLAHAGRKGSTKAPWQGSGRIEQRDGGWTPVAPSAVPFSESYPLPQELSKSAIEKLVEDFTAAARHAEQAGFQVIEIHMAHGYLGHEFLSPISNKRTDEFGGSLENRMRFPLAVAKSVRLAWPKKWPVFVRISATDWAEEGGWDLAQSVTFAQELKKLGIDLIDCSTGGTLEHAKIPVGPGYQVRFASEIRAQSKSATGAVGVIVTAEQAELILREGQADVIFMAREFLRDPYFPLHAAKALGFDAKWPVQYERAKR
jgi:2,4-dienoyl-CoA reductase-like NADH-dependent reductase (Old Yellow Enzyme family)